MSPRVIDGPTRWVEIVGHDGGFRVITMRRTHCGGTREEFSSWHEFGPEAIAAARSEEARIEKLEVRA